MAQLSTVKIEARLFGAHRWPGSALRSAILNLGLALSSVLVSLLVSEIVLRTLLFGESALGRPLREAVRYADYFSDDDYWKLLRLGRFLRGTVRARRQKAAVNRLILSESVAELRRRQLDFLFVLFHPRPDLAKADWRTELVEDVLKGLDAPYISTRDVLQQSLARNPMSALISPSHNHPTTLYNQLIASEMKRWVLKRRTLN